MYVNINIPVKRSDNNLTDACLRRTPNFRFEIRFQLFFIKFNRVLLVIIYYISLISYSYVFSVEFYGQKRCKNETRYRRNATKLKYGNINKFQLVSGFIKCLKLKFVKR